MIKLKTLLFEETHSYCSTHVKLSDPMRTNILSYINSLPEEIIDKENGGREDNPHITLLYGINDEKYLPLVKKLVKQAKELIPVIRCKLDRITFFENDKFDVMKIDVVSDDLERLHYYIRKNVPNGNKYPIYHPHLTLAYIKKGMGRNYNCNCDFKDIEMNFDHFEFTDKTENPTVIYL